MSIAAALISFGEMHHEENFSLLKYPADRRGKSVTILP